MNRFGAIPPVSDRVCRLILGTSLWNELSEAETHSLFDAYAALGGNCLDTALVYYDVECTIGSWLTSRRNRSKVLIHAKGSHHETVSVEGSTREFHRSRLRPEAIQADITESLRRLQADCLDIFTLHRDDADLPIEEIMDCLATEYQRGRVRAYGASNWSIQRLEEAAAYAEKRGISPFVCSSPNLALAYPNEPSWPNCVSACDRHSRRWYADRGMPLLAWSPIALGFFTPIYGSWESLSLDERRRFLNDRWMADVVRVYYSERNFLRKARAEELAKDRGVTPTQLALAWVLHQGDHVFAVAGPRTVRQLEELFDAFEISLSNQELAWLNLDEYPPKG